MPGARSLGLWAYQTEADAARGARLRRADRAVTQLFKRAERSCADGSASSGPPVGVFRTRTRPYTPASPTSSASSGRSAAVYYLTAGPPIHEGHPRLRGALRAVPDARRRRRLARPDGARSRSHHTDGSADACRACSARCCADHRCESGGGLALMVLTPRSHLSSWLCAPMVRRSKLAFSHARVRPEGACCRRRRRATRSGCRPSIEQGVGVTVVCVRAHTRGPERGGGLLYVGATQRARTSWWWLRCVSALALTADS